jgi:hypothetical protein
MKYNELYNFLIYTPRKYLRQQIYKNEFIKIVSGILNTKNLSNNLNKKINIDQIMIIL